MGNEVNFLGLKFPVTLNQLTQFEKMNPVVSITVLGFLLQEVPDSLARVKTNERKERMRKFKIIDDNTSAQYW